MRNLWNGNLELQNLVRTGLIEKTGKPKVAANPISVKKSVPNASSSQEQLDFNYDEKKVLESGVASSSKEELLLSVNAKISKPVAQTTVINNQASNINTNHKEIFYYYGDRKFLRKNVNGDGNCLFRCFSVYLFGNESSHLGIRKDIVNHVCSIWESVKDTIEASYPDIKYKNKTSYKNSMGSSRTFGTDFEVGMFSAYFKINVGVYAVLEGNKILHEQNICYDKHDDDPEFKILLEGSRKGGHWVILEEVQYDQDLQTSETDCTEFSSSCDNHSKDDHILSHGNDYMLASNCNVTSNLTEDSADLEVQNIMSTNYNDSSFANNFSRIQYRNAAVNITEQTDMQRSFSTLSLDQGKKYLNNSEVKKNSSDDADSNCKQVYDIKQNQNLNFTLDDVKENNFNLKEQSSNPCEQFENNEFKSCREMNASTPESMYDFSTKNSDAPSNNESTSSSDSEDYSENDNPNKKQEEGIDNNKDSLRKKKKFKKGKLDKKFKFDYATVEFPSHDLLDDNDSVPAENVRKVIRKSMNEVVRCTCPLVFYGSVRVNRWTTTAYARCGQKEHVQDYKFLLSNYLDETFGTLFIYSTSSKVVYLHKNIIGAEVHQQVRGNDRKIMTEKVKGRSVADVHDELLVKSDRERIIDNDMKDLPRRAPLYTMKSEDRNKQRLILENGDLNDVVQLYTVLNKNKKDPYFRYLAFPLTAHLYCEEDLECMDGTEPMILHMDATGSLIRMPTVLKNGKIFEYDIVSKHTDEIVKLATMITCKHGIPSISTFLKNYRAFIEETVGRWPFANAMVVDWAWASIHSILHEWNNLDVTQYLQILYDYCYHISYNDSRSKIPKGLTIVKICYSHFMKIVATTIDEKFTQHADFRHILIECLALLALSKDLRKTDELFKNIAALLLTKNKKRAYEHLKIISDASGRNKEDLKNLNESEFVKFDEFQKILYKDCSKNSSTYKQSAFYKRFNTLYIEVQHEITLNESDQEVVDNEFYAPDFLQFVLSTWIPYIVMWSALDMNLIDPKISRISNAFVESSNKVLKEKTYERLTCVALGQAVRKLKKSRKRTMAIISRVRSFKGTKKSQKNKKPKYPEDDRSIQEQWSRKKSVPHTKAATIKEISNCLKNGEQPGEHLLKKPKRSKKKNSSTVENKKSKEKKNIQQLQKASKKRKVGLNIVKNEKVKEKLALMVEEKNQVKNKKKVVKRTEHGSVESSRISKNEVEKNEKKNESGNDKLNRWNNLPKHYNGLFKDVNYYMVSDFKSVIATYTHEDAVTCKTAELRSDSFWRLSGNSWFDDPIIDCWGLCNLVDWPGVTYVTVADCKLIFGDHSDGKRLDKKKTICKMDTELKNTILMPSNFASHYRLFVVNIAEKTVSLLDPFEHNDLAEEYLQKFKTFTNIVPPNSSFGRLRKIDWTIEEITDRPYQIDLFSCGPFVCYYLMCAGKKKSYNDPTFNPSEYRNFMSFNLLLRSLFMLSICIFCPLEVVRDFLKCKTCKRMLHLNCYEYYVELIGKKDSCNQSKRRRTTEASNNIPKVFQCHLCKIYENKYLNKKLKV